MQKSILFAFIGIYITTAVFAEKSSYKKQAQKISSVRPSFCLDVTPTDRYAIHYILRSLGEKNLVDLLVERQTMYAFGDRIRHLHPLVFLGNIILDPYLKRCLKKITDGSIDSRFKWNHFLDGFKENMIREKKSGRLVYDLPAFSELVNGDLAILEGYVQKNLWEDFIKHFLQQEEG